MPDNSYRTSNLGPKVSHSTTRAYGATEGHYLIPSWMTFEVDGPANLDGAVTSSGNVDVTGTLAIGSGTSIALFQKSTVSVSLGAVPGQDGSVATTGTVNAMTADSVILSITPASIWSGDYYQVNLDARVSAVSTFQVYASNVSATDITPDAMNMDLVWFDPA